jgi:multiple sugar transport system permease protein
VPILNFTDLRAARGRLTVAAIYASLAVGGLTMVVPFLIMMTGSLANGYDYERRALLPRHLWSREDRFMRALCAWFPPAHRASMRQMKSAFPTMPADWQTWSQVGDEERATDAWARRELAVLDQPNRRRQLERAARDYHDFLKTLDLRETVLAFDMRDVAPFLRKRYGTIERLNRAWEISIDDFTKATVPEWSGEPLDQQSFVPIADTRYQDLLAFRKAYRDGAYAAYLGGPGAPATLLRPATLRYVWEEFVGGTPEERARLCFPVPADGALRERALWKRFLRTSLPVRHVAIEVTAEREAGFQRFLQGRFRTIPYMNRVLDIRASKWSDIRLTPTIPEMPLAKVWLDFVLSEVPVEQWTLRDTLPEAAFQRFALRRYGSLGAINAAYGLDLQRIEQLHVPLREAILTTFANREAAISWNLLTANYRAAADYLFQRGDAVRNTLWLVLLSMVVSITVNPLAGYALSRFRLKASEQVIVFCLATMAFPAAVAAIPGFLLLRDLGLLNTFAALVLPGAANGMTIFLLKGFFDSLPRELYEAATIDGAPETVVFWRISLPLVKPILAVGLLNAFLAAYNGWEWAIIVCQDPRIWTVAVWTYQFHQNFAAQPYTVMAAFILNSLPVLAAFLLCQRIILRGIILPQMK